MIFFHTRLNYDSATKARQDPTTHILYIKTYPHDKPNIRPFLKTSKL